MGKGNEKVKDVSASEGDRKRPTRLRDLEKYVKFDKISIEESTLSKTNDNMEIKTMMENQRLVIEADEEGRVAGRRRRIG